MPSSVERSARLSGRRLSSRPASRGAGFSSDEDEDGGQPRDGEEASIWDEGQNKELEVMDVSQLTDMELRARLLQFGVKAGPIVASTRTLYEKKLQMLLKLVSQPTVNGAGNTTQYSDGEDDDIEDEELTSSSAYPEELPGAPKELHQRGDSQMKPLYMSVEDRLRSCPSACQTFSITQLVEELESRNPDIRKVTMKAKVGVNSEQRLGARGQMDVTTQDRYSTSRSSFSSLKPSVFKQQFKEPVTDVLTEMFPGTDRTPTGISATCRRPIKGAAGRPVQFKYPDTPSCYRDTPSGPDTKERDDLQRHRVAIWVQILVFLFVAFLFYLIFTAMEGSLDNCFTALLEGLGREEEEMGDLSSFTISKDHPLVSGEE